MINSFKILRPKFSLHASIPEIFVISIGLFLPIGSGFTLITGINLSKVVAILVVVLSIYTLIFTKIKKKYFPPPFILLTIFMLLHIVVAYGLFRIEDVFKIQNGELILTALIRFVVYILFAYLLAIHLNSSSILNRFTFFFSIGYIITMLVGFTVPVEALDQGRLAGGFENPNSFATASLSILFLNLFFFLNAYRAGQVKILNLVFCLIGLLGLVLSQSRAVLLGVFISSLFLLFSSKGILNKLKVVATVSIVLLITVLMLPSNVTSDFKKRADVSKRVSNNQESRLIIWQSYLNELPSFIFFGKGRERATSVITKYNLPPKWQAPHNRYLFVTCEFGIIGLILFLGTLISIYRRVRYSENNSVLAKRLFIAFFISWLTMLFFGDYKNSRDYWLFLALLISYGNNFAMINNQESKLRNNTKIEWRNGNGDS